MNSNCRTIASAVFVAVSVSIGAGMLRAQTALVAHRSHSGSDASFVFAGTDNFGLGPERIDSVQRLTDSTVIKFTNEGADTVIHRMWSNPGISIDSLSRRWPGIKFIDRPAIKPAVPDDTPNGDTPRQNVAPQGGTGHDAPKLNGHRAATETNAGVALLMLAGAAAVPLLAVGIHRADRRRNR